MLFLKYSKEHENEEETEETEETDGKPSKIHVLPERLQVSAYKCSNQMKDYFLFHILKSNPNKSIMVFTNSISHTKKLFSIFSYFDFNLCCLHSKMQQKQRIKNLDKFRTSTVKNLTHQANVLLCTDVGARGLDVPLVDIIINYHIPKTTETFIHRSGRTARAFKGGQSISLVSGEEVNKFQKIVKDVNCTDIDTPIVDVKQLEKYKSIFNAAKNMEKEEHNVRKDKREKKWYLDRANECDLELDEENIDDHDEDSEKEDENRLLNRKRKFVKQQQFKEKKIINKVLDFNIGRSSFLTPDKIAELSKLMKDPNIAKMNLTTVVNKAKDDVSSFKFVKQRKTRHVKRRKR